MINGVAITDGHGLSSQDIDLMYSSSVGDSDKCSELLLAGANPDSKNGYGWNALMLAASNGHFECVRLLKPLTNQQLVGDNQLTASMLASMRGHIKCLVHLLRSEDGSIKADDAWSSLIQAAAFGQADCVSSLLPLCARNASDANVMNIHMHERWVCAIQVAKDLGFEKISKQISLYRNSLSEKFEISDALEKHNVAFGGAKRL